MTEPAFKNQRILIVDDDIDHRGLHRENLEDAGYVCYTASNGAEALEVFAAKEIDLAVVDVMMSGMSGLELFMEVKQRFPGVAVLFVSAVGRMDVAISQIKGGALDYLVKPVEQVKLIEAVETALAKHSENLENAGHQKHLEELLLHQSKALENKVREVRALNRMFSQLQEFRLAPGDGVSMPDSKPGPPEAP